MDKTRHAVVVVGGSIGGLRAASLLARSPQNDVTLVSKKQTFDYRTSLHRSKKGRSKRHISIPLERIFPRRRDIDLVRAEIETIDPAKRVVRSSVGDEYSYDSLIVALEGESRIPKGIEEGRTHNAYSASSMSRLRRELTYQFEYKDHEGAYIVVGGGETGVEVIHELKKYLDKLAKIYGRDTSDYHAILIENSKRLVPKSNQRVGDKIYKKLHRQGVEIFTGVSVEDMNDSSITLSDGQTIDTKQVILAAGRRANHFFQDNQQVFLLGHDGFVRVNSLQEAEGYNNIYIIGNSKESEADLNTDGLLYDAEYVAELLDSKRYGREIHQYEPPDYKARIQLGKLWSAYETADYAFFGRIGWALKRWRDREHFSTLLPLRLWFVAWARGSRHDEIY